jgi:hypothetical protein
MNTPGQNNVYFYGSQRELAASQPYAIHNTGNVTFMVNRFNAWTNMMTDYPRLSALCVETKSIHIMIAATWCEAIDRSKQEGLFPIVILPVRNYEQAMLLLKVTCQMEADIHQMIEQRSRCEENSHT